MSDQRKGGISWTDDTWNPIRGCSRVSAGCRNCYAETMATRFSGKGMPYHGLAVMMAGEPTWTGSVVLVPERLEDPLRWKRPRRIFVNSMSDLFHEALADEDVFRVFRTMAKAPHHVFQVLTKRSKRMRELMPKIRSHLVDRLDHVWLGVSVEHQDAADERIPDLIATPAAVRWLSVEPMLGPVGGIAGINWIVVGGESGNGARPMSLEWARAVRDQSGQAAFFMKQLGSVLAREMKCSDRAGKILAEFPADLRIQDYPR